MNKNGYTRMNPRVSLLSPIPSTKKRRMMKGWSHLAKPMHLSYSTKSSTISMEH
jgi:hypothetical protein